MIKETYDLMGRKTEADDWKVIPMTWGPEGMPKDPREEMAERAGALVDSGEYYEVKLIGSGVRPRSSALPGPYTRTILIY